MHDIEIRPFGIARAIAEKRGVAVWVDPVPPGCPPHIADRIRRAAGLMAEGIAPEEAHSRAAAEMELRSQQPSPQEQANMTTTKTKLIPLNERSQEEQDRILRSVFARIGQSVDLNGSLEDATLDHLHESRQKCLAISQAILDKTEKEQRELMENEKLVFDEMIRSADFLQKSIEARKQNGTTGAPRYLRALDRGDGLHDGGGRGGVDGPEMWRTTDGKNVPALRREHRMADFCPEARRLPQDPDQRRLTFGGLVRAMVIPDARGEHEIRALSEGTDSAGGFTVPTPLSTQVIDLMRAKTRVVQAGAVTVPMTSETLSIARVATDPTLAWKAEAAESTPTDMTFERVLFTSHTLRCVVLASQELLQDSVNVEQALMDAFAGTFAVQLDRVALRGTGLNDEPTGILNQSNVLTIDNNGSAIASYGLILDAIEDMLEQNSAMPTAVIMAPRSLIKFNKLTDTTGQPLMRPPMIQNLPFLDTTSVPTDDTQGSPANLTKLYVGDYTKLMIGMRLRLNIQVLRERYAEFYQYGFLAAMRVDIQLRQPKAFNVITEVL